MTENAHESEIPISRTIRHYADILNPLFWNKEFNRVDRVFEWACTILRIAGMADTGWDSYAESIALLNDLTQLMSLELPNAQFPNKADTRARLAVIAYCHMVEMDVPYELLANLLRLHKGLKYSVSPFSHLNKLRSITVNGDKRKKIMRPGPAAKIREIGEMASELGVPELGLALNEIYNSTIRNAVSHSDYAIHDGSFRLLSGFVYSRNEGVNSPLVSFDDLGALTSSAFAFHSALLALWQRQKRLFIDFKGKILPYDDRYKGVIEFTFEDEALTGVRVYWPNNSISICSRHADGRSEARNVEFEHDGSINFFVGLLANRPSSFSPLVEIGKEAEYAFVPGTDKRPYWPGDLRPYAL